MKLFTVADDQQRAIIERLIDIQRKPLKERRGLIKGMERDGYTVDFIGGRYQARSEGALYRIPLKRCPSCNKRKSLDAFLTLRDVEHPWCQICRHGHPVEAERARAERNYHVERGTYDPCVTQRCQNPQCPNGGVIPPEKLKRDPSFCSRECWRAVRSGPARHCKLEGCGTLLHKDQREFCSMQHRSAYYAKPCANPECSEMVMPPRKYHSRECFTAHRIMTGHFKAMSEKGNESQFATLKATGHAPKHEKRGGARRKRKAVP